VENSKFFKIVIRDDIKNIFMSSRMTILKNLLFSTFKI